MKHRFSVSSDLAQPVVASESSTDTTPDPLNNAFVEVRLLRFGDEINVYDHPRIIDN